MSNKKSKWDKERILKETSDQQPPDGSTPLQERLKKYPWLVDGIKDGKMMRGLDMKEEEWKGLIRFRGSAMFQRIDL